MEEEDIISSGKNLFLNLVEHISKEFNIWNCWICGDTQMVKVWPWEGTALSPQEVLKWMEVETRSPLQRNQEETRQLRSRLIGKEYVRRKGRCYTFKVGELSCKCYRTTNGTRKCWTAKAPDWYWSRKQKTGCIYIKHQGLYECITRDTNPFTDVPQVWKFWSKAGIGSMAPSFWVAPEGLFWLCGERAYVSLPGDWKGSCTLGIIRPSFFLLSHKYGQELSIPLYDDLGRKKKHLAGGTQKRDDEGWAPERIIPTYGLATWAQDGSCRYWTPIYVLNRIIRLQAVLEIITNQTALALDLITAQQKQMRSAIYQKRLALDYLLAEEGGVCGKFNSSECCIEIDDHGKAIKNITKTIRKLTHVPVQWWMCLLKMNWWENWLNGSWWKKLMFFGLCALTSIVFLLCILPCLIWIITSIIQTSMEKLAEEKMMMLQTNKQEGTKENLETAGVI